MCTAKHSSPATMDLVVSVRTPSEEQLAVRTDSFAFLPQRAGFSVFEFNLRAAKETRDGFDC